jgi:AraC-like DNA-binding protein
MHQIKTYERVDHAHKTISFRISRMEQIYEQREGVQDEPHRHDYYTLLLVKKARGKHMVDFQAYPLSANQVYFISPGQVHQVMEDEKSYGYVVLFSTQFLVENHIPAQFIEDLRLFQDYSVSPPLELNKDEFAILSAYCEAMITLTEADIKFRNQALSSYLKLFLIQSNNLCSLSSGPPSYQETGHVLLRSFRELVEKNHTRWHQASEYARELHVSPDHLNRVIKTTVGKTAKEFIQSCLVLEAKRMIYFSGLSAKEIGYALGFSEPSNFSAFFKKHTGMSPSHFRESN